MTPCVHKSLSHGVSAFYQWVDLLDECSSLFGGKNSLKMRLPQVVISDFAAGSSLIPVVTLCTFSCSTPVVPTGESLCGAFFFFCHPFFFFPLCVHFCLKFSRQFGCDRQKDWTKGRTELQFADTMKVFLIISLTFSTFCSPSVLQLFDS